MKMVIFTELPAASVQKVQMPASKPYLSIHQTVSEEQNKVVNPVRERGDNRVEGKISATTETSRFVSSEFSSQMLCCDGGVSCLFFIRNGNSYELLSCFFPLFHFSNHVKLCSDLCLSCVLSGHGDSSGGFWKNLTALLPSRSFFSVDWFPVVSCYPNAFPHSWRKTAREGRIVSIMLCVY